MNPLARLLPALITLLRAPALVWEGADVNVWEHLPGNEAGHYVLVEQATRVKAPGSTGCKHWSCTVLFRVITQFEPKAITNVIAEEIAGQIIDRIEGEDSTLPLPRLELGPGYACDPAELVLDSPGPPELDGELVAVTRLLRYRWEIFYSKPSAAAITPVRAVLSGRVRTIH